VGYLLREDVGKGLEEGNKEGVIMGAGFGFFNAE